MSEEAAEDFLAHYGVKGMRWGVRRDDNALAGISNRTRKDAKKDAEEFTRAKLFYGKGAGTRRKLIKATVETKSKKDADYKKAFDHYVNQTDLGKRASQAKSERKRKDVTSSTTKTVRGVHRSLTGGFGAVPVTAAAIAGAYTVAQRTGADKTIARYAKTTYSKARAYQKSKPDQYQAARNMIRDANRLR